MEEIQGYAQTRIRMGSGDNLMDEQRDTGNLVWAPFTHGESRPVEHPDGAVTIDPHLHQHVFVHNITYDEAEGRWKAMKERAILERAVYFEQNFEAAFARELHGIGYNLDRRGKYWDIVDVSPEMAARYSLRTNQVNELKEKLGITSGKAVGELGARSRSSKTLAKDVDLHDHLQERSPEDCDRARGIQKASLQLEPYASQDGPLSPNERAELAGKAVSYALEKSFERRSTAYRHHIFADAMRFASAGRCVRGDIEGALEARKDLILGNPDKTHKVLVTTTQIVEQERALMEIVRNGRAAATVLVEAPRIDSSLNPDQMAAVSHVLASTDQVIAIRGQAGTGKSYLLTSLVSELQRNDIEPVALAPTVAASRGSLRKDGLDDANTMAMFLSNSQEGRRLREQAKGGVVVLDEAGLASTPEMLRFMEQAQDLDARVLLVGDTRQMASVERGDALRLLEDDGLMPAELKEVIRQRDNETYKAVVEEMATGRVASGLRMAQEDGFVVELEVEPDDDDDESHGAKVDRVVAEEAARRAAESYEKGQSNIVVAPTHALGRIVTTALREELQAQGLLGEDVASMKLLRQIDYCAADRGDAVHAFQEGDMVVMRRDDEDRGLHLGEVLTAQVNDAGKVHLFKEDWSESRVMPGLDPRAFSVYRSEDIPIAVGDQVRAFEPIKDMERGDRGMVKAIDHWTRTIELADGREVSMDSKYLGHGYVTTVQGSQGLSVDHAIVVAPTSALPAMSQEAMYVAASRGKAQLDIITDDVEALRSAVGRSVERSHGVDVAKDAHVRELVEQGKEVEIEQQYEKDILAVPAVRSEMVVDEQQEVASHEVVVDEDRYREPAFAAAPSDSVGRQHSVLLADVPATNPLISVPELPSTLRNASAETREVAGLNFSEARNIPVDVDEGQVNALPPESTVAMPELPLFGVDEALEPEYEIREHVAPADSAPTRVQESVLFATKAVDATFASAELSAAPVRVSEQDELITAFNPTSPQLAAEVLVADAAGHATELDEHEVGQESVLRRQLLEEPELEPELDDVFGL